MIKVIKEGIDGSVAAAMDSKVRTTVEGILGDIGQRGDAAVRELSDKFDRWTPQAFRLSEAEIEACIERLPQQAIDDIRYAQTQIRRFAEIQKAALQDVEGEALEGALKTVASFATPIN